uniref:Uncharacterized protein n=1 Tax=Schizaphis graminum TaxID=13262 RepID=A0A2S2N6I5_SCHGA
MKKYYICQTDTYDRFTHPKSIVKTRESCTPRGFLFYTMYNNNNNMYENLPSRRGIISIIKVEKFLWFCFYENHLSILFYPTINIVYMRCCQLTEYPHHVCRRPFC